MVLHVTCHDLSKNVSVYAVEGLLVVHRARVEARVPFSHLLNDIPEYKDLFCCAPSLSKASLFPSQLSIFPSNNPLNQNSSQHDDDDDDDDDGR